MAMKSMELTKARGWRKAAVVLATGLGCGLAPVASGTAGTVPGVLLLLALGPLWRGPVLWQAAAAAGLCLLALPLCEVAERHFGRKDDGRIVADEYLVFPVCMLGLPLVPWMLAAAFLTCRVFDVLKPPPARRLQALPGGLGIVADDLVSNLYSLAANHLIYQLAIRFWG